MTRVVKINPQASTCKIEQVEFPMVGFGTYPLVGAKCTEAVKKAMELGYRIIDTATFYNNLDAVGDALQNVERSNYYIISKVWHNKQQTKDLQLDLNQTLQQLQTPYLDAYLLHWPNSRISIEQTLQAMQELQNEGKIRHIGLSNVTVNHLKRALEVNFPITWVQVEMHPYFYDAQLLDFCHHHGIAILAWSPLARGLINGDDFLQKLAKKYHKSVSQIALRWIVQHSCLPIPASQNPVHIAANTDIVDFSLSPAEMDAIDAKAKTGKRTRITEENGLGFTDEFDFTYEQCWPH